MKVRSRVGTTEQSIYIFVILVAGRGVNSHCKAKETVTSNELRGYSPVYFLEHRKYTR